MKKSITELCELIRGVTFSKGDAKTSIEKGYIPVFRSNNIQDGRLVFDDLIYVEQDKIKENQILKTGDVVITASTGSKLVIGKAAQLTTQWTGSFGAFCIVLRPKTDLVDSRFLGYYFQTPGYRKAISHMSSGANINNLKKSYFDELKIELPSLEDQKRIVRELDAADSLRQKRKQAIALLDDYLKAVFLEMFGDPVENPKGWGMKNLGELCRIKIGPFGSLLHKQDYVADGIPLVNPKHMINGKIVADPKNCISKEKHNQLKDYQLETGDLIMARRGEIGRCALVSADEDKFLCGTGSIFLRPIDDINNVFLLYLFLTDSMIKLLEKGANGVTMQNLNAGTIKKTSIISPPVKLQHEFAEFVRKIELLRENMIVQYEKMTINFNSLVRTNY